MINFITILTSLLRTLAGSFVFMNLWTWFLTPVTKITMTYFNMLGLFIVFQFFNAENQISRLTEKAQEKAKDTKEKNLIALLAMLGVIFLWYPIALLTAFGWHLLMSSVNK